MTVYVDEIRNLGKAGNWCHLWSPNIDELHIFAKEIGLKRSWFQNKSIPHYDLRPNKQIEAIRNGAKLISSRELVLLARDRKRVLEQYKFLDKLLSPTQK